MESSTAISTSLPSKSNIALLLGAGASVEGGVPSSTAVTERILNYSTYCPSSNGIAIENCLRHLQVQIAEFSGKRVTDVNFELIVGALVELSRNRREIPFPFVNTSQEVVRQIEATLPLERVLRKIHSILKESFLATSSLDYLQPLRAFAETHRPLSVFTLNYDNVIERACDMQHLSYTTGFRKPEYGDPVWDSSEFESEDVCLRLHKLHGSIDWGQFFRFDQSSQSSAMDDPFTRKLHHIANYPPRISFDPYLLGRTERPGEKYGMESAMNYGMHKELLYASTQFTELFHRFIKTLDRSELLVVVGYSFGDDRINGIIEEAIATRSGSLRIVVIDPNADKLRWSVPLLYSLETFQLASFTSRTFGECLKRGLKDILDETISSQWSGRSEVDRYVLLETESEKNQANTVTQNVPWEIPEVLEQLDSLDDSLDLLGYWFHFFKEKWDQMTDPLTETDLNSLEVIFKPMFRSVRDVLFEFNHLQFSMGFAAEYDMDRLARLEIPSLPHRASIPRKTYDRLVQELIGWTEEVYAMFHTIRPQFKLALEKQPNPSESTGGTNFQLAELILRQLSEKLAEFLNLINYFLQCLNLGRPFDFTK